MRKIKLLWPVVVAFSLLLVALVSLRGIARPTYAQSPSDIEVIKVLNQPSPVVKVGQFISFTIYITNQSTFTLEHASLFDDYRQDILGSFSMVGGDPPPTVIDPANGQLTWTGLISQPAAPGYFPQLPPGQRISITMQFQVEHPPAGGFTIVNRAQIRDAIFSSGPVSDTGVIEVPPFEITGTNATLTKQLHPPDQRPGVGDRLTYTIQLVNDGAAAITEAVLVDTFNPAYLSFFTATPTSPTSVNNLNGVLTWTNLIPPPLQPGQVISLAVVFELLQSGIEAVNRIDLLNARDFFGNDLAPGSGEAGITIIADTPTPTPLPKVGPDEEHDEDDEDEELPAPTPTATPVVVSTPTPLATVVTEQEIISDVNVPLYLPETGRFQARGWVVPIFGLILLTAGWYLFRINKK